MAAVTNEPAETPSDEVEMDAGVGKVALIATFYGPRESPALKALEKAFDRAVKQASLLTLPTGDGVPTTPLVRPLTPAGAEEAAAMQVALNAPGMGAGACATALQHLVEMLAPGSLDGLWGYSLVYEAALDEGVDPKRGLKVLLDAKAIRRLDGAPAGQALAAATWGGGHLWLLDIPTGGEGYAAATVYAALSDPAIGNVFIPKVVYGVEAELLLPDLVAHEGYFEARPIQPAGFGQRYEHRVDALRKATTDLLDELQANNEIGDDLGRLSATYDRLNRVLPELAKVRLALRRLRHNYGVWERRLEPNEILEFHRLHLEKNITELDLLSEGVRDALNAAQTALSMVQAKAEQREEERQLFVQTLLAFIATLAVVPQLIDNSVTTGLLHFFHVTLPNNEYLDLKLFAIRMTIAIPVALMAVQIVNKWAEHRQSKNLNTQRRSMLDV